MKKLILYASSMIMLALHANGQQLPEPKLVAFDYSEKSSTSETVRSSSDPKANYSYTVNSNDEKSDDPMKSKTFTKTFTLDRSDKINLSNTYGSITIKTWAKNEIKVDVDIKAFANSEKDAQDLLDKANISAGKDGDEVSFKTKIDDQSGSWGNGSRNGKRWRRELKVYYVVYMPSTNALSALQQYGNLTLDDFSGATSLKVQYGNLVAGDLRSSNNYISIQYGKGTVQNVNSARVQHQYGGGITMGDVNDLELNAQYTSANIGNIKNNANIKHQYGSGVTIASANTVTATVQYAGIKIGRLLGNFTAKAQYGKITVDAVEPGCKVLNADGQYSPIILGFAPGYGADFDASISHGSFKYGNDVTVRRTGDDDDRHSSSKSYSGQVGKGGSNKLNLKLQYNSLTFK